MQLAEILKIEHLKGVRVADRWSSPRRSGLTGLLLLAAKSRFCLCRVLRMSWLRSEGPGGRQAQTQINRARPTEPSLRAEPAAFMCLWRSGELMGE